LEASNAPLPLWFDRDMEIDYNIDTLNASPTQDAKTLRPLTTVAEKKAYNPFFVKVRGSYFANEKSTARKPF
jgi:hypothetical protein